MLRDPFSPGDSTFRPEKPEDKTSAMQIPMVANLVAILSLILGIISLLRLGLFSGPLAILLGYLSRKDCSKRGIATAGMVCGSLTIAVALLLIFLFRNAGPPSYP